MIDTKTPIRTEMSLDEFYKHVENYFRGEDMTALSFLKKYSDGGQETPEEMFRRVIKEFYRKETEYGGPNSTTLEQLEDMVNNCKYIIPQGSVLASLGVPGIYSSLSNCTVLGEVPDSYGGIGYRDQQLTHLMKRRCGVGGNLDNLRPKDTPVNNSARKSTGVVSFMNRFSNTTNEVAQGGRRGALMLSINVNHPDSIDFITSKLDTTKITGANISVQLEDEFMEAAVNGEDYFLRFPVSLDISQISNLENWDMEFPKDELVHYPGNQGKAWVRKVNAGEVWDKLMECAWQSAEPGVIFRTRHDKYCPSHIYRELRNVTTNPCGEIMMGANDSCRLIAMNLFSLVVNPFTEDAYFDFGKFKEVVRTATRMSDNLVDLEIEAIDRIVDKVEKDPEELKYKQIEIDTWKAFRDIGMKGRRQGLGFTGLADMVAALGLKYDSKESLEVVELVMKAKFEYELRCQIDLAKERGAFPLFDAHHEQMNSYDKDGWFYMVKTEFPDLWAEMQVHGRRSCSWSTVAPTGTISLLAGVSSGIEPAYMLRYNRRKKVNPDDEDVRVDFVDEVGESWTNFAQLHPNFKMWAELHYSSGVVCEEDSSESFVDFNNITEEEFQELEKASPWYGATAEEIDWIQRVELQAIVQKYTTHSISSTINLPNDVSVDKVKEIYTTAWRSGLKGVTVYRDGCRTGVLTKTGEVPRDNIEEDVHVPKRPERMGCKVVRFQNNYEKWIAFIGLTETGRPYEIFTGLEEGIPDFHTDGGVIVKRRNGDKKKRYDFEYVDGHGQIQAIRGLEKSFNPEYWNYAKLVSGLLRHRMPLEYVIDTLKGLRFEDIIHTWRNGVVRALKKCVQDGSEAVGIKCLGCGGKVVYEEGCEKCINCGSSKCG